MSGKQEKRKRSELIAAMLRTVHKRELKNGDLILVKNQSIVHENMEMLSHALAGAGFSHCIMVAVNDFDDLSVLDEKSMEAVGLYRIIPEEEDDDEKDNVEDEADSPG